jgi:hypothetical protein
MNVQRREGFVDEQQPKVIEAKAEKPEVKSRPMPPPEIDPSPAEEPAAAVEEWPLTIKLINKAIRDNKGSLIHEVVLREPRAGDINRNGNPIRINSDGEFICDERKMTYMIAALSDIMVPFIEEMHPRDWNTIALKLRNFFLPDPRGW